MGAPQDAGALRDPYVERAKGEGIPIVEDFAIDNRKAAVSHRARFGMNGAFCHLIEKGTTISSPFSLSSRRLDQILAAQAPL